jgi:hypothetical protein
MPLVYAEPNERVTCFWYCKADPDGLLFAIVDKHVRRLAQPAAAK